MLPTLRTHSDALIAALEAAGLTVGDGHGKDSAGVDLTRPYAVLFRISGRRDGSVARPDDDLNGVWQVTGIGDTREQAEWVTDTATDALVEGGVTVAGRAVKVNVDFDAPVDRDDDSDPPLFYSPTRYRVMTSPT